MIKFNLKPGYKANLEAPLRSFKKKLLVEGVLDLMKRRQYNITKRKNKDLKRMRKHGIRRFARR